jgi:hypothetical protein
MLDPLHSQRRSTSGIITPPFFGRQGTFATIVACTIDGNNLRSRRVMLMRGSAEFIAVWLSSAFPLMAPIPRRNTYPAQHCKICRGEQSTLAGQDIARIMTV